MVELHGGTVTLESQVDRGSRFTVTLPWLQSALTDQPLPGGQKPPHGQAPEPLAQQPAATRPLVLLVSQDATTLHLIQDYLGFKGYEVAVIATAAESLNEGLACSPAAIVLDLPAQLDEQNHPVTLIRTNPQLDEIPIISLVAYEGAEPATNGATDAYLKKPIRLQELAQLIGATLAAKNAPESGVESRQRTPTLG
jgi:CheY-like chemotaxis protein